MYYLVTTNTEAGIADARETLLNKYHDGLIPYFHFDRRIYEQICKVTGEAFKKPVKIRSWFKRNRANFCGGNNPNWNSWLNGEDSNTETIGQTGKYRFFFMKVEDFDRQNEEFRRKMGFVR